MRRLTDFEKVVVKKLNSYQLTGSLFYYLFLHKPQIETSGIFRVKKTHSFDHEIVYSSMIYYSVPEGYDVKEYKKLIRLSFKRYIDVVNLLLLLEENGLIYFYNVPRAEPNSFIPSQDEESIEEIMPDGDENDLGGIRINDNNFKLATLQIIPEKAYNLIYSTIIYPSEALEIFVQNDCRTEEHKLADEAISHNEVTRKQAEQASRIANLSARQARNAVWVTALLGFVTLGYSCYRDYKKDNEELSANSEIVEAKKREEFYRDEMVIQADRMTKIIEGIRKDLKQVKPSEPAKQN